MDEFTRAVFEAVYHSRAQRLWRILFGLLLALKHILRGLVFSWPLYLLSAAGLALPGEYAWAFLLLLIPAFLVSGFILSRGLREDYRVCIQGRLLKQCDWKQIMFGSAS